MKPDERALAAFILNGGDPFAVTEVHPKRLHGLLLKWTVKGWWDYGTSPRAGWLTDEGLAALASLPVAG